MEYIAVILFILVIVGGIQTAFEKYKIGTGTRAAKDLLSDSIYTQMLLELTVLLKRSDTSSSSPDLTNHEKYIAEKKQYVGADQKNCPTCKVGVLVQRKGTYGKFYGCSTYPKCRHTQQRIQRTRPIRTVNPVFGEMFLQDLRKAYQTK